MRAAAPSFAGRTPLAPLPDLAARLISAAKADEPLWRFSGRASQKLSIISKSFLPIGSGEFGGL